VNKTVLMLAAVALVVVYFAKRSTAGVAAGGAPRPSGVAAGGMTSGERWLGVAGSVAGNAIESLANGFFGAAGGTTPSQRDIDIGAD
jgi:hypothetical protein